MSLKGKSENSNFPLDFLILFFPLFLGLIWERNPFVCDGALGFLTATATFLTATATFHTPEVPWPLSSTSPYKALARHPHPRTA